jgi:hypothetical protein
VVCDAAAKENVVATWDGGPVPYQSWLVKELLVDGAMSAVVDGAVDLVVVGLVAITIGVAEVEGVVVVEDCLAVLCPNVVRPAPKIPLYQGALVELLVVVGCCCCCSALEGVP